MRSSIPAFTLAILVLHQSLLAGAVIVQPPDLSPGDPYRLIFVTSELHPAHTIDVTYYNDFVSRVANSIPELQVLNSDWLAIASVPGLDARTNTRTIPLGNPGGEQGVPIYRLDGVRVANDNADLWDGSILAPIEIDELGNQIFRTVWTGATSTGTSGRRPIAAGTGTNYGSSSVTDDRWVVHSWGPQNEQRAYYAISGSLLAVPEPSTGVLLMIAVSLLGRRARRIPQSRKHK